MKTVLITGTTSGIGKAFAEKAESNSFSRSEQEFFCSVRDFKKNYLKPLLKKHL